LIYPKNYLAKLDILAVSPRDINVVYGDSLSINVNTKLKNNIPILRYTMQGIRIGKNMLENSDLLDVGSYSYVIKDIRDDFSYSVKVGSFRSQIIRLKYYISLNRKYKV
jgi:hypothetical protein